MPESNIKLKSDDLKDEHNGSAKPQKKIWTKPKLEKYGQIQPTIATWQDGRSGYVCKSK